MIDFNTEPYNDDFDENNKFYRILFRPSFAVQARELTQMQTILQNQIKRNGDHVFKEGAMVIPGQSSIDCSTNYVKLQPLYAGAVIETYVNNLEGLQVYGKTTGVQAEVIKVENAGGSDPATLYVRYTTSGTDNETKVFADDEEIAPIDVTLASYTVKAISVDATGIGSTASIERGVYYTQGFFVLVDKQVITLDKYSSTPTYRIGLRSIETLVTPEDTGYDMLLDNAQNSYNYAAPGAHRYMIDLLLEAIPFDSTEDTNFIELLRVNNGSIVRHVTKTEYSELEKTLARRTYDESGNYVVRNFTIDVREHRNNNRGMWAQNTAYLLGDIVTNQDGITYVAKNAGTSINVEPTHLDSTAYDGPGATGVNWEYNETPYYNRGVYTPEDGGSVNKLAIGLEPGKAYVQGYEIEKIATEYVTVDKARSSVQVDNAVIPATVGNYIRVTNVNSLPPIDSFATVKLYDRLTTTRGVAAGGTQVGTARVRLIEWDNGTIGSQTSVYKLSLFDIKMFDNANFSRKVKSLYYEVQNGGIADPQLSFTADISQIPVRLAGLATANNSQIITGSGGSLFSTQVSVGDYVSLGGTVRRVTAVGGQTQFTVDTAVTVSNVTIDRITTELKEPGNSPLLFNFPYYAIKSVRSSTGTNDTTYTVYDRFTGTSTTASGGSCTLTVSTTSGSFASAAETDNYIVLDNNATDGGSIINPSSIVVSGSSVTFTLPASYASRNMIVIGAVNKTGVTLTEKAKTLVTEVNTDFSTAANTQKTELLLGKADGYRVVSVKMATGTFDSPGTGYPIDITDRYSFDNGQRDTHYDVARLVLRASYTAPVAPIEITWEYFSHSTGDYFTVNSYPNTINYSAIPLYNGIRLADSIDFRPRIDDAGVAFNGSGSSMSLVPKRGIDVRTDYTYYLPRKTKIAMDFNGQFFAIDGVAALNPGEPSDPSLGMVLYTLSLEPYTFSTTSRSVAVTTIDNKRYTMRDIGKLEKRIDNLEYYTSLSLLEQQTESLDVIDSNGDTRFKNGFIVDNFSGHTTGDTNNKDYLCSIDMERGELRPFFSQQNVNLIEKNSTSAQRAANKYKLYGDVITLPLDSTTPHVELVKQEYASRVENINPFAIFTFLGNLKLNPETDDWFETDRRPDIVVDVEGNFNTIKNLAEKSGTLGTVWNSWQTQWTGAPQVIGQQQIVGDKRGVGTLGWADGTTSNIDSATLDQMFGSKDGGSGWAHRVVNVETTAWEVGLARQGVKTSLVTKIDRQVVADRVLSTAAIPFIRSRNVLAQITGLKPNTKFYPYFDDVDVSAFCTPASKISYTPVSGTFDSSTNVGGLSSETTRRIDGDSQVCLNKGDVVVGQASGASGVVVGTEYNPDTQVYSLFVVNVKGTFSSSETLVGSVSGARGTFSSFTSSALGDSLITNFSGDVHLLFKIPNSDSIRFRTGLREFKLIDNSNANGEFTSRGRAMYRAQGVLETKQATINAVRNAEIVSERVSQGRTIIATSDRIVSDTGWYDPLAQTFLVQNKGGCFLSKIDLFFATKDAKIPVNVEIREVVNGYPGKLVLPFSKVSLKPEQVDAPIAGATIDVSKYNTVTVDGTTLAKYDKPTTFTFPSPVYVQDNTEYAIVVSSDSNNYKVWISNVGDTIPGSSRTISEQPYAGVFFKSQNASTWTADQNQDLKFTIYRAKFDTANVSDIAFVNDALPFQSLDNNSLETRSGESKVRVYQRDHGMPVGSRVVITDSSSDKLNGIVGTGTVTAATSGPTVTGVGTVFTSELETGSLIYNVSGTYIGKVLSVESNTGFTLTANPTNAMSAGSAFVHRAPYNGIPVTEIYNTHIISDVDNDSYCITTLTEATATGYTGGQTMKATRNIQFDAIQPIVSVQTFSDTSIAYSLKGTSGKSVDSSTQIAYSADAEYNNILANETNYLVSPKMVASEINEQLSALAGSKSLSFNVAMRSNNDSLSPILDTQRTSMVVISNKTNNPTQDNLNVGGLDDNPVFGGDTVAFAGATITSTDSTTRQILQTLTIGKYLTIAGSLNNDGTHLISGVADNGTTATVTFADAAFTTESAGSWVTLAQKEMFVAEIAPEGSSSFSKYVTKKITLANSSNFIKIKFAGHIPPESDIEVWYRTNPVGSSVGFEQLNYTRATSDAPTVYSQIGTGQFFDIGYSIDGLPSFDALQVKIVLKSSNTSAAPRLKDLRIIACA